MILNIVAYHFVPIDDPPALALRLQALAEAGALRGTALVAPQRINLFLAGTENAVRAFIDALRNDARFAAIPAKESLSHAQPFARLKVKVKSGIISFRCDGASPLDGRAPAVSPETLACAGLRKDRTTLAVAWCCWTRAIAKRSTTAPLRMH